MVKSPKNGVKKGAWSEQEDKILINYIEKHGKGNWPTLSKQAGLNRCGKSCRLRWNNYLKPGIKRGGFSEEEEATIIALRHELGNKWSRIASQLPGRTDNEIKNFCNTHLRKKLLRMSTNPQTHKPITDLNLLGHLSQAEHQLLSVSNLHPFMNPYNLKAAALSLQTINGNELIKIQIQMQILQKMLQIVIPYPLQYTLGNLSLDQLTLLNQFFDPLQAQSMIADFTNISPLLLNQQQLSISEPFPCFDCEIIPGPFLDDHHVKDSEYSLPSLVSVNPESFTVNQMESFTGAPDNCYVFNAWENLVEEEASRAVVLS
ncbi:hypothetical protein ACH5RR_039039 [Cinchona calisaya]|uniref:Uncharacterized protein n=1 Tax=Cinchona calisaya TaxID=153742 RepID=A0ABD2XZK1_9GENT